MKIVREIASNKALYLFHDFEEVEITSNGMKTPNMRALDIKSDTHECVEGPEPDLWVGGALAFDGSWSVVNQDQYDKAALKVSDEIAESTKIAAIESYNNALAALEAAYPQKERDTWPQQVTEARSYLADDQAATPLIDAMLTTKPDTTKAELVGKIMTNYTAYSTLVGAALGAMQEAINLTEG